MYKYTVNIDGMMCGMCEAHMNDAIRKAFDVTKVRSNHKKGLSEIVSGEEITEEAMKEVVESVGYDMKGFSKENYKKKLFGF